MRKYLTALFLALGVSALFIPGVQAQLTGASTGVRTVISDLIEWTGTQKFRDNVEIGGALTVTGAQTTSGVLTGDDLAAVDDLTVGDDAAITGDLTVTGTTTLTGGIVNGSNLSTTASKERIYTGTTTLTEAGGAETVFTITNATTQVTGAHLFFTLKASDATDYAALVGQARLACVNVAGTTAVSVTPATQAVPTNGGALLASSNSKTLTYAAAGGTAANACTFTIDIDSDMTTTSNTMEWVLILQGPGTVS